MIAALRHWWFFQSTIHRLKEWPLNGIKLGTEGMSLAMKSVIVMGEYEKAETVACTQTLRPGDRVLELGGAIGYIGLHCLINCKAASVVSIEANPVTAQRLRQNYILNGRKSNVINAAVSDQEGPVEFSVGSDFWTDGISTTGEDRKKIQVPGKTLAQLWDQSETQPNVLVSDIEGAETLINWDELPKTIERILIELHPSVYGIPATFRLLKTMMDSGFDLVFTAGDVYVLERN